MNYNGDVYVRLSALEVAVCAEIFAQRAHLYAQGSIPEQLPAEYVAQRLASERATEMKFRAALPK